MATFDRHEHSGNAIPTTLGADLTTGSSSLTLAASTGWPTGTVGPFYLVVGQGLVNEEKMLAASRSGTTISGLTRGVDGTSASIHTAGETIVHGFTAIEADEANQVAKMTVGSIVAAGDSLWATGPKALVRVPAGSDGAVVKYDSAQPAGVSTGYINENSLATSVWGPGLNGGPGVAGSVNVDGTTLTVTADQVGIKAGGVTTAELLDGTILKADIAVGVLPTLIQGAVTGGPTASTTELTIGTLTIAGQPYGYTVLCSAFWSGINDTIGDQFTFRIRVNGNLVAQIEERHSGGVSERRSYAIPCSTAVAVAASTAAAVTVTVARQTGTGTINTADSVAGLVTAWILP